VKIKYDTAKEQVLKLVHPCKCRKCENPCSYGSGAFIGDEAEKLAEFLKINGLEAEVMEPYGNTTRRVLFIRKIEEIEPVELPKPEVKGPQQSMKDLKKGLK